MENQKISLQIPCPIHASEFLNRVHMEVGVDKHLYCFECLISSKDASPITSKLRTIPDLLDTASKFYARNKEEVKLGSQVTSEYDGLVSGQAEKLEKLSKHIENEKKKSVKSLTIF